MPNLNITINLEYDGDLDRDAFMNYLVDEIRDLDNPCAEPVGITSLTVEATGDDN